MDGRDRDARQGGGTISRVCAARQFHTLTVFDASPDRACRASDRRPRGAADRSSRHPRPGRRSDPHPAAASALLTIPDLVREITAGSDDFAEGDAMERAVPMCPSGARSAQSGRSAAPGDPQRQQLLRPDWGPDPRRPLQGRQGSRAQGRADRPTALRSDDQQDPDAARSDSRRGGPLRADRAQPGQDEGREVEGGRAEAGAADRRASTAPAACGWTASGAARNRDHGRRAARLRADASALARSRPAPRRPQRRRLKDSGGCPPGRSRPRAGSAPARAQADRLSS